MLKSVCYSPGPPEAARADDCWWSSMWACSALINRAPDGSWMRAAGSLAASETGHYEAQKELRPRW